MTRFEAKPWMERGVTDVMQCDSAYIGVTENWHIAQIAHFNDVKMVPHNWDWHGAMATMCNTHLVAAIPMDSCANFAKIRIL